MGMGSESWRARRDSKPRASGVRGRRASSFTVLVLESARRELLCVGDASFGGLNDWTQVDRQVWMFPAGWLPPLALGTTFQVPLTGAVWAANVAAHASKSGSGIIRRIVCLREDFFIRARFISFIHFDTS